MIELTQKEIIFLALEEYEKNHWNSESQNWQKKVNKLMGKYSQ